MEVIKIPKVEGIIDRRTGRVLNRKLRVAAYARVSTTGAEQLNSYESQKKYYYEKINDNPEWEFVNIYADEGISGTTDYKRAGFMKMIQDALAGKMHSKTMIVDDEFLVVGSMNFSNSGENRNDENVVILKNAEAAKFYKDFFLYQWDKIPEEWLKYTPRAEGKDSIGSCSDGIDNDYDGKIDMEDEACKEALSKKGK